MKRAAEQNATALAPGFGRRHVSLGETCRAALLAVLTVLLLGTLSYQLLTRVWHYRATLSGCEAELRSEIVVAEAMLARGGGVCEGDHAQAAQCVAARQKVDADPWHEIQRCYERDTAAHRRETADAYYEIWLEGAVYRHTRLVVFGAVAAALLAAASAGLCARRAATARRDYEAYGKLPTSNSFCPGGSGVEGAAAARAGSAKSSTAGGEGLRRRAAFRTVSIP